jgi:eukaryotic-like serine/threonine-protein kinase
MSDHVFLFLGGLVVEELQAGDPRQIGSYRLLRRLGRGGMGRVFLGESPGGRLVAVKVVRPELADSPDFRARFAQEVIAARRVSGLFTAPVVDADPDAAEPWLVTGYVDGPSLADAVADAGSLDIGAVRALARALAEGLAAIHAAGVVHRDLKPSNVLLAADGPRIIDFGISRAADATAMTRTGMVVGSPGYMSPEQANGREVGPASDMFSLGSVLIFAATGQDPFGTGDASALLYRVVHTPAALASVPADLRPVIEQCMRKDPPQRLTPGDLILELADQDTIGGWPARQAPTEESATGDPASWIAPGPPSVYSQNEAGPAGRRASGGSSPLPAARTAVDSGSVSARPSGRRRRIGAVWAAAAAVIIAVAGAGIALGSHLSGTPHPPRSPSVSPTVTPAEQAPEAVVRAYFAAIDAHDWHKVWQLGGKNLGQTYASMVTGFRHTRHDKLTSLTSSGDSVSVRILAYETAGTVQTYALSFTVSNGVITSGQQTLLAPKNS